MPETTETAGIGSAVFALGGKTIFLLLGLLSLIIMVILIYWLRTSSKTDLMLERKKQWMEEAKKNKHPDMQVLFLTHTPSLKSYVRRMEKATRNITANTATAHQLKNLLAETRHLQSVITEKRSPIYYGDITGWVTEDILANLEDFYIQNKEKIREDERMELERILENTGRVFHIFTYKKSGGILGFLGGTEEMIIAPDEQVTGVGSIDGVVVMHGIGTRRIGRYFSILTGDPAAIDLFRTHVVSLSRIDVALQQEASIGMQVQRAAEEDVMSAKAMEFARAIRPPRTEDE